MSIVFASIGVGTRDRNNEGHKWGYFRGPLTLPVKLLRALRMYGVKQPRISKNPAKLAHG
jgi:hypothetical protein